METETNKDEINKNVNPPADWNHHSQAGRIMGGFIIVGVGSLFLARQLGVLLPPWLFTWQMGLIVLGIFIGAIHTFRGGGWLIPIIIGGVMLIDVIYPGTEVKQYIWPIIIISAGLFMIFNSRAHRHRQWKRRYYRQWHRKNHRRWEKWEKQDEGMKTYSARSFDNSTNDYLESVCIFGEIKKNIISKDFKGGESVTVFGGSEINLMQADINGRVTLDLVQVFGGMRLIVPPHWQIDSQLMVFLGGIEDKRPVTSTTPHDPTKVLVLQGNVVFGGLEIKSY